MKKLLLCTTLVVILCVLMVQPVVSFASSLEEILANIPGVEVEAVLDEPALVPELEADGDADAAAPVEEVEESFVEPANPIPIVPVVALTATPTSAKILVNGEEVAFDAYSINDYNFFKLRDLAFAINGSEKQFNITYDEATNSIVLVPGEAYVPVGDEMDSRGEGNKSALPSDAKVLLAGEALTLEAYNIEDYNYFKLRDVAAVIDFGVGWNEAEETITIVTAESYVAPEAEEADPAAPADDTEEAAPTDDEEVPADAAALLADEWNGVWTGESFSLIIAENGQKVYLDSPDGGVVITLEAGDVDGNVITKTIADPALKADVPYTITLNDDGTITCKIVIVEGLAETEVTLTKNPALDPADHYAERTAA